MRLEEARGWGRRSAVPAGVLRFSPDGLVIEHGRALAHPLELPLAALALATVDPGPARAGDDVGRLPVLRRLSRTAVIPREDGIEGWLWTSRGGSALASLAGDDAPNGALLFTKPLAGELVTRHFAPDWVAALAARSPLGDPVVLGLLLRLADTSAPARSSPATGSPCRSPTARSRRRCAARCRPTSPPTRACADQRRIRAPRPRWRRPAWAEAALTCPRRGAEEPTTPSAAIRAVAPAR